MPRPARDVMSSLLSKGFVLRENDHAFLHLYVDGKKTAIFTKISHGEKEIGDNLLSLMARQVKLSSKQFRNLVDCPMSEQDLIDHLRSSDAID